MIKRIELKNFMSHEHTVLEPAEGLTVLIGPNNVGKSAVIAALQILCYNDNSTYVMRHGAKECSIKVETDDGHTVQWKRKKSPSYVIDGEKFDRLARSGVPDELHAALRLKKVDTSSGKDPFDVHFGAQKSPIFLLDQSGGTAARFFASSSDAIRLVAMQQRHKEKVKDARKERTRLDSESKLLNAELATLEPVVAIDDQLEKLEANFNELQKLARDVDELTQFQDQFLQHIERVERHRKECKTLDALASPPTLEETVPVQNLIADLCAVDAQMHFDSARQQVLETLASPPELNDVSSLLQVVENLSRTNHLVKHIGEEQQVLCELVSPPSYQATGELEGLIERFSETSRQHHEETERQRVLASLKPLPELSVTTELKRVVDEVSHLQQSFDQLASYHVILGDLSPLEVAETGELRATLIRFDEVLREQNRARREVEIVNQLEAITLPTETADGEQLRQLIEEKISETNKYQAEVDRLNEQLEELTDEIKSFADSSSCPVCGGVLNVDTLIDQAARGLS